MSSNLMDTEKGGEQTQYEGEYTDVVPNSKSSGQLGTKSQTTTDDPSATRQAGHERSERGEKTAANIRYGQSISEGGMSGFTTGQDDSAEQGGFGGVHEDRGEKTGAQAERKAQGYGDQNREIGA